MRSSIIIILLLLKSMAWCQSNPSYTVFTAAVQGNALLSTGTAVMSFTATCKANNTTSLTTPPVFPVLREKNRSAKLYMKLDLGNDYVKTNSGWDFKAVLEVNYKFTGFPVITKTLTVTNTAPEMLLADDVLSKFITGAPPLTATVNVLELSSGATPTVALSGLVNNFVSNSLRVQLNLVREYDVDVRLDLNAQLSPPPLPAPPVLVNRLATFSWLPATGALDNYPNYQVQLVKVYNMGPLQDENILIVTKADWSKALTVETQSYKTSIKLSIGEGSGYYFWRVRPIGTYFEGGIANSENYGSWSHCDTGLVTLSKNTLTATPSAMPFAFYVDDPDEALNWMYSRTFTEGDAYDKANPTGAKISEGISYADGLQHQRQDQKYNSEENTSTVFQTINDYSGRPALSTIPVPGPGGLTGYKANLVRSATGLYTAAQFDADSKLASPDLVDDNSTSAFSYYSGSPATGIDNSNVADAEGYLFKRTLFKTDGSSRVTEEGGVGKAHSIGLQTNGQGHTTRFFYGVPSDDELIRIFGSEAPLAESVLKTISIDQNNVMSVSYTSKEGKTIATALSSGSADNLAALGSTATAVTVTNTINQNIRNNDRVSASRRIAITADNTQVNLSYVTNTLPDVNAGCISSSCNLRINIYLHDLKNNAVYQSDSDIGTAGLSSFTAASGSTLSFPASWAFVSINNPTVTLVPAGSAHNQLTLQSGEYIFVKEFISANSNSYADSLVNVENDRTRMILSAIAGKMSAVDNATKQAAFQQWMSDLKTAVNAYTASPSPALSAAVWSLLSISYTVGTFPLPPAFELGALLPVNGDAANSELQVSTSCCGSMSVKVPNKALCAACDGNSASTSTLSASAMSLANDNAPAGGPTPYGLNDFEADPAWVAMLPQHKISYLHSLVNHEFIIPLQQQMADQGIQANDLWKLAPGFTYESLNFMIANMLISRYYAGSAVLNGSTWYECSAAANGNYLAGSAVNSQTYHHNYDCKKLYEAWTAAVTLINTFELDGNNNNVLQSYDAEQGPDAALNQILDVDSWAPPLQSALFFLENVISGIIHAFSHSHAGDVTSERVGAQTSLTGNFLEFAGYQFAAIVDGSALPAYISAGGGTVPDDYFDYSFSPAPGGPASIYRNMLVGSITHSYVPYLFNDQGIVQTYTCGTTPYHELYYPYTLKPEWMFKYFVYNVYHDSAISDDSLLVPHQVNVDVERRYNEPFSYLPATTVTASQLCMLPAFANYTLGTGTYSLSYTHNNWSVAERNSFYKAICGGAACPAEKGIPGPASITGGSYYAGGNLPTCKTKAELIGEANSILNSTISDMYHKTTAIKTALINELGNACYTLVPCKSTPPNGGEVTDQEVSLMVSAVIDNCVAQINHIKNTFTMTSTSSLTPCSQPSLITQSYSVSTLCDLPACAQEDCYEIIYYDDNTLGLKPNRTIHITYFNPCDQNLLSVLENGAFIPDIPKRAGCTKPDKLWKSCTTETSCGPDYGEKADCSSPQFSKYSKEYTITATGTN